MRLAAVVSFCLIALSPAAAWPGQVRVLAVLPAREVLHDIAPDFKARTGLELAVTLLGSTDVRKRVDEDSGFDLVLTVDKDIEAFIAKGLVVSGSKVDLMRSSIGFAVPKGRSKPVLAGADDLKAALLSAASIGYSTGSSGVYLEGLFQRLGILDEIRPKLRRVPSGSTVGQALAAGQVEIGFQQVSELIDDPTIDFVGPLPPDLQQTTVYSAGVGAQSPRTDDARALAALLASPTSTRAKIAHGMDPIAP